MSPLSLTAPDPLWLGMGLAALAGVGASAAVALDRAAPATCTATLRFPADLSAGQVRAVLDTVAGLHSRAVVRLAMRADPSGISFDVTAVPGLLTTFTRTLAGIAPSLRVDALSAEAAVARHPGPDVRGARLSWRGAYPLLRSDEPEAMVAALLGAVSQLRRDERLWLQLALMPAGRGRLPARELPDRADPLARLLGTDRVSPDQRRAVVAKYQLPLLRVGITIAVQTPHRLRHAQLVARVTAVLRTRTGLRGGLHVRRLSPPALGRAWSRPPRRGTLLSSVEAVALTGWPLDAPAVPGMHYGTAPRLLPAQEIPAAGPGRLFGVSTWPGHEERRVIQPSAGTTCHSLLLGPSGSGKSWLLANLALGQLAAGEEVVLLDMKGDTAADVLSRLDPSRHDDVLILEPSNGLAVPGLRCFSGEPELAADLWLSIFRGLFTDSWGVRSERYLRMAFVTLATSDPGSSVADVPRLFADARYRRRLVAALRSPARRPVGRVRGPGGGAAGRALGVAAGKGQPDRRPAGGPLGAGPSRAEADDSRRHRTRPDRGRQPAAGTPRWPRRAAARRLGRLRGLPDHHGPSSPSIRASGDRSVSTSTSRPCSGRCRCRWTACSRPPAA